MDSLRESKRNTLLFNLKRGPDWNRALTSSPNGSSADWPSFLTQLAIHQRRLRIELFNKDGKILSTGEISLEPLHKNKSAKIALVAKLPDRLAKIVIRP